MKLNPDQIALMIDIITTYESMLQRELTEPERRLLNSLKAHNGTLFI